MSRVFIAGHSRGAAEAALYAFSRIKRGLPVDGLYLFESPRPGNQVVRDTLASIEIVRSIKNVGDPVTDVPLDLDLIDEDYEDAAPFTMINEPYTPNLPDWGPVNPHHIELVQAGCRKLPPTGGAIDLVQAVDATYDLYNMLGHWDWTHPEDGRYWGMRKFGDNFLLIARGSVTGKDWLLNFEALQIDVLGARVSDGFWAGVAPVETLDAALALT